MKSFKLNVNPDIIIVFHTMKVYKVDGQKTRDA